MVTNIHAKQGANHWNLPYARWRYKVVCLFVDWLFGWLIHWVINRFISSEITAQAYLNTQEATSSNNTTASFWLTYNIQYVSWLYACKATVWSSQVTIYFTRFYRVNVNYSSVENNIKVVSFSHPQYCMLSVIVMNWYAVSTSSKGNHSGTPCKEAEWKIMYVTMALCLIRGLSPTLKCDDYCL